MEQTKYRVSKEQLLLDLRLLSEGIFEGECAEEDGALVVTFSNGQRFFVRVEEDKTFEKRV